MPEDFYYKNEHYTLWDDGKLTSGKDGGAIIALRIYSIEDAKNKINKINEMAKPKTGWGWGGRKTRGRKSRRRKPTRRRRR